MIGFIFRLLFRRAFLTISVNLGILASLLGFFVVKQTDQMLVLQFGQLQRVIKAPGLHWKIPLIQTLVSYEKRVLNCDISEIELTLGDQKRIIVSVFSRYFIKDPELFYKTVQTEDAAKQRLDVIINGDLRNILGRCSLQELLSSKRAEIEQKLSTQITESAMMMGMDMMEIKIKAVLFPEKNQNAVFDRMKSERLREAKEWSGKAIKVSSEIRSKADITAAEIVAKANQDKQTIIGEAEATKIKIKSEAYNKNPEFGKFYNRIQSYGALKSFDFVIGLENEYLKLLKLKDGKLS